MNFNFPPKKGSGIECLLPHASKQCVQIIVSMCEYDPESRTSAKHILRHPYFKEYRCVKLTPRVRLPPSLPHRVEGEVDWCCITTLVRTIPCFPWIGLSLHSQDFSCPSQSSWLWSLSFPVSVVSSHLCTFIGFPGSSLTKWSAHLTQLLVNHPVKLHYIISFFCPPSSCHSTNTAVLAYLPHLLWFYYQVNICQHNKPTSSCQCWVMITVTQMS